MTREDFMDAIEKMKSIEYKAPQRILDIRSGDLDSPENFQKCLARNGMYFSLEVAGELLKKHNFV